MKHAADVIIVGAGAAGLMAARCLSDAGKKVIVLEARERSGGRIFSKRSPGFEKPVHLGAEFIHGELPITLELLQEARIPYFQANEEIYQYRNGKLEKSEALLDGLPFVMERLEQLHDDISVTEFLEHNFKGDKYSELRQSVAGFVQGYDAADPDKMSALALRDEFRNDRKRDYRIEGGYMALIDYLVDQCRENKVDFSFSSIVNRVEWQTDRVELVTSKKERFKSEKVIITVPAGVLQVPENSTGAITFDPPVPWIIDAAKSIGFGSVTKFVLHFSEPFWKVRAADLQFLVSDQTIPTWWMQMDTADDVFTGWLAGPQADLHGKSSEKELLDAALQSLSVVFKKDLAVLKEELTASEIYSWAKDPFSKGAYSYSAAGAFEARNRLQEPTENTLFFAGEAIYTGVAGGTVEAALASGRNAAEIVLKGFETPGS